MRILIAEDDKTSRAMLSAALEKVGYKPIEVTNGSEAWQALQKPDAPKLAILDWMIPEINAIEVIRRVRTLSTPQPPYILILTPPTAKAEIGTSLEAGANDYLAKPFNLDELQARVAMGRHLIELQHTLTKKMGELQAIIQSNRDGLIMISNEQEVTVINQPAMRLLHLPGHPARWLGRHVDDLLPMLPEVAVQAIIATQAQIAAAEEELKPATRELELGPYIIHWENLPVMVDSSRLGCLFVLRDITKEQSAAQMRTTMMRTMVHDLRNPLAVISGALELMQDAIELPVGSEVEKMLEIASISSQKMLALVSSILDISRLESGRMPLSMKSFDLQKLITDHCAMQMPLARPKGIDLTYSLPDNLPMAWGDPAIIRRVLQNLVDNGLKFTPQNGRVHIEATSLNHNGRPVIQVTVQDTGPGIPPEMEDRLFEQFAVGQHAKAGSGLGLAYCQLALEAHGQAIYGGNSAEGGAVFTITLSAHAPSAHTP